MGGTQGLQMRAKRAFGFAALIFLLALLARRLGPDLAAEGQ